MKEIANLHTETGDLYYNYLFQGEDDDDESTIEEQEIYEAKTKSLNDEHELAVLTEDNAKPLEDVLACAFPNYDLTTQSVNASEAQHDSSISSAEDSDDSDDEDDLEEYDFSGID